MEMCGGAPGFSDWKEARVLAWDPTAGTATVRYEPWCAPDPTTEEEDANTEAWWAQKMTLGSDADVAYDPAHGRLVEIAALLDCRAVKR